MKFLPTAVCGVLLALPLSGMAQSGASTQSQSKPSTPAATAPANRAINPLTPGEPAPPLHPITMEQTKELLRLMDYKKVEDNNWSQMIAMNKRAAPFIPDDVWTDVQTNVDGIDYASLMQPIYAKYLSQEDAAKALEFYGTPAGKRVLQSMPVMLGEGVAAAQQKGRQAGRDAIEKHRAEIEAAQKKYQAEHAPPAGTPGSSTIPPAQPNQVPAPTTPATPAPAKPQK